MIRNHQVSSIDPLHVMLLGKAVAPCPALQESVRDGGFWWISHRSPLSCSNRFKSSERVALIVSGLICFRRANGRCRRQAVPGTSNLPVEEILDDLRSALRQPPHAAVVVWWPKLERLAEKSRRVERCNFAVGSKTVYSVCIFFMPRSLRRRTHPYLFGFSALVQTSML
eukprot:symbB.v1.2.009685.t1/scaffold620.1/size179776/3